MSPQNTFTTREFADPHPRTHRARPRQRTVWILGGVCAVVIALIIPGAILMATANTAATDRPGESGSVGNPDTGSGVDFGQLRWEQVGRTELPFSPSAGPRRLDGVAAHGFAHTRAGSILAAWQIPTRLAVLSGGTEDIYSTQVIGTDSEIASLRDEMADLHRGYSLDYTIPRVIAWRAHRPYSDDVASYDFALPGESDTEVRLVRFSVVWLKDDWRYQPGLFGAATDGPVDARSVNPGNGWNRFPNGGQ